MKLNLFEKLFVGAFVFKLFGKYRTIPKTAYPMTLSWLFYGAQYVFKLKENDLIWYSLTPSIILLSVGLLSFLYFDLFKSRKPKTEEDINKFITYLD